MPSALLISIRFHDGRYHGRPDWPPSPARLFQALVAGAARGNALDEADARALEWLEQQNAPIIAAPIAREAKGYTNFVPNNDLDAVGGDPRRIGEIRAGKSIKPRLFDADVPLLYAWSFDGEHSAMDSASRLCAIAERLYQLGRGVDMAWAWGEIVDAAEVENRLAAHGGAIHSPSFSGEGAALAAPQAGSLTSLTERHAAQRTRFSSVSSNRTPQTLFTQPSKPRFRQIAYDSPPTQLLYDLNGARAPWQFTRIAELTTLVRDAAARKLAKALPVHEAKIEHVLIGRNATEADKAARVRIIPLPSIGHRHADHAIRRVVVEIPPSYPLPTDDIAWAFSGLAFQVSEDGEVLAEMASANDRGMLCHYGIDSAPARTWRTVTPVALPDAAKRRRIEPARRHDAAERKGGSERVQEEGRAIAATVQALRHAGVSARPTSVRVQREPFEAKGARAEAFAVGTRFAKERLWHVEIDFQTPVQGPLVIGDGRYLGLGLMAAQRRTETVVAFAIISGLADDADAIGLARALRRAVMARVQALPDQRARLPKFFTGHELDGSPARVGAHEHLAFVFDQLGHRLLIIPPHLLERRQPTAFERDHLLRLEAAMRGFSELAAGASGKLRLAPAGVELDTDPLFAPARAWQSATPYRVTKHRKCADAAEALVTDITDECRRIGLPRSHNVALHQHGVAGLGLVGHARLLFATAVPGPIMIGRDRHFGGGLFTGG